MPATKMNKSKISIFLQQNAVPQQAIQKANDIGFQKNAVPTTK